jgi:hypothetical protein
LQSGVEMMDKTFICKACGFYESDCIYEYDATKWIVRYIEVGYENDDLLRGDYYITKLFCCPKCKTVRME